MHVVQSLYLCILIMLQALSKYKIEYRTIVTLALPIIIGQLGGIITGLTDTLMVGWHSTNELAAASFVNNVANAFIITGTGFSFGLTPIVSEALAQKKYWEIGRWLRASIVANVLTALLIIAILLGIYLNIERLGQPEELIPIIKPYFAVVMVSVLFVMAANAFRQFVEGITDAKVSMWILIAGNTLNIVGNYVLIYGKCGLPELGLYGAGISTLISRIIMLLLFVGVFLCRRRYASYRLGFISSKVSGTSLYRLNALGWPIGLQQGLEAATFCFTAVMVGWLGSLELAAHQIAITISTVSYTIFLGIGAAVAIRTGYFKGANDWLRVRRITVAGFHIGLMTASIVCVLLCLIRNDVSVIFTDSSAVADIVVMLFPILILYQFFDGTQIILANALRGLADVKSIMWISFITNFLIAIPVGYLLGFVCGMGITGIWLAYPAGFLFSGILLGGRARKLMNSSHS